MKILMAHNYYRSGGGVSGENTSFETEAGLLRRHGHEVIMYKRYSDEIFNMSRIRKAAIAGESIWALKSYRAISRLIKEFHPDVAHFQNFQPLISPSAYYACKKNNIPVVQCLSNFRVLCPGGVLLLNEKVCKKCVEKRYKYPAIRHACYQDSHLASFALTNMLWLHFLLRTWEKKVDRFITPSNIIRDTFIQAGFDKAKFIVMPDPVGSGDFSQDDTKNSYGLFVGRLSEEKGISLLLKALEKAPEVPFKILGNGPLLHLVKTFIKQLPSSNVQYLGERDRAETLQEMKKAGFCVLPSICIESFGRVIIEAFSVGKAVIASRHGPFPELIHDREDGLLFAPGSSDDLAQKMYEMWKEPSGMIGMGVRARKKFEEKYAEEIIYNKLINIYHGVINRK